MATSSSPEKVQASASEQHKEGGHGSKKKPAAREKIKCNMSWARMYVPGTAESLAKLPPGCEQSCLNNPLGRHTWVARFRHPKLMEIGKRPTRSKSYMEGVTEHQAFQIVVSWLWERYRTVCRLCDQVDVHLPIWVEEALADCAACQEGSVCTFMEDQEARSKTAAFVEIEKDTSALAESDSSEVGTSATESSVPDISGKDFSKAQLATNLTKKRKRNSTTKVGKDRRPKAHSTLSRRQERPRGL